MFEPVSAWGVPCYQGNLQGISQNGAIAAVFAAQSTKKFKALELNSPRNQTGNFCARISQFEAAISELNLKNFMSRRDQKIVRHDGLQDPDAGQLETKTQVDFNRVLPLATRAAGLTSWSPARTARVPAFRHRLRLRCAASDPRAKRRTIHRPTAPPRAGGSVPQHGEQSNRELPGARTYWSEIMSIPTSIDPTESDPAGSRDGPLYVRRWERLSDALRRVMAAAETSRENAQPAICQAIADKALRIRGRLKRHASKRMTSKTVLAGDAFQIPELIKPSDLDWEGSRPVNPWVVSHEATRLPGYWSLAWIEVRTSDVTEVLCGVPQRSKPTRRPLAERLTMPASEGVCVGPKSTESRESRRRGRRATKFNATVAAMRQDIAAGGLTPAELGGMLEKNLAERYGVSRDTARKARTAALSEMAGPNSRQMPTNDK